MTRWWRVVWRHALVGEGEWQQAHLRRTVGTHDDGRLVRLLPQVGPCGGGRGACTSRCILARRARHAQGAQKCKMQPLHLWRRATLGRAGGHAQRLSYLQQRAPRGRRNNGNGGGNERRPRAARAAPTRASAARAGGPLAARPPCCTPSFPRPLRAFWRGTAPRRRCPLRRCCARPRCA